MKLKGKEDNMTRERRKQQLRRRCKETFIVMFSIAVGVTVVNANSVSKDTTKVFSKTAKQQQEVAEEQLLNGILVKKNIAPLKLGMSAEEKDDKFIEVTTARTKTKKKTKRKKSKSSKPKKVAASKAKKSEVKRRNTWKGPKLNRSNGTVQGPSGKETYYNLNMSGVVRLMEAKGFHYKYWVRKDGVKMYGKYIMCAANLNIRPKGTILKTSLGKAMVCDTGSFASSNAYQLDIAVSW